MPTAELERRETLAEEDPGSQRRLGGRARQKAAAGGSNRKQAKPKRRINTTSRTLNRASCRRRPDGFLQGYNAQAAVEPDLQLIVGQTVTEVAQRQATVAAHGGSHGAAERAEAGRGSRRQRVLLGEESAEGLESAGQPEQHASKVTLPRSGKKHDEYRQACPKGPLPKGATRVDRMRRKLKTKREKPWAHKHCKAIVEPVFRTDQARAWVLTVFVAGIDKVRGECGHWCVWRITHLKCRRLYMSKKPPPENIPSVLISTDRTMPTLHGFCRNLITHVSQMRTGSMSTVSLTLSTRFLGRTPSVSTRTMRSKPDIR